MLVLCLVARSNRKLKMSSLAVKWGEKKTDMSTEHRIQMCMCAYVFKILETTLKDS